MPVNKDFYTLAGSSGQSTGYEIDQSIRFNDDDSARMYRTPGSAGNRRTHTFSCWLKRGNLSSSGSFYIFSRSEASYFYGYYFYQDMLTMGSGSASNEMTLRTTRRFRDPSAWYHIVLILDTTQTISNERARMYINGVRETDFSTETYPSLNAQLWMNTTSLTEIGVANPSGVKSGYFDGLMAQIHFLDGYAYGPEYFGEFDDYGIWRPIEYEEGNYGTNGFYIDGRDSSDLGDDESGQGNDFTTSGLAAHDQVLDTPTNNFCVMSSIDFSFNTIKNGNLETIGGTNNRSGRGTMGFTSGKFYWEVLATTTVGADKYGGSGVIYDEWAMPGSYSYAGGATEHGGGASHNGATWYKQSASGTTYGSHPSDGDIYSYALDRDNNKIYWAVNGTYRNSGNPAGGSGAVASSLTHYGAWMPFVNHGSNAGASASTFNFGQDGTFGGAKTAQGNSDGNGVGNFYYSPPSGFLALCTRNLGA